MNGHIVVGFSGDSSDSAALRWAVEYATPHHIDVELVHVMDDSWGAIPPNLSKTALIQAEHHMREVARRAREENPALTFHTHVTVGSPTETLSSRSFGAALLVVGTLAHGRLDERLFGTRGAQIAARAHCSTVIVPERERPTGSGVVVGVDGSDASAAAVEFAARYADRYSERLHAIYAWNPPMPFGGFDSFQWPTTPDDDDQRVLAQSVAGLESQYPRLELELTVATALPADALTQAGRGARLLVVGTHGRRGISKLWLGSVSRDVAQVMPCPVAIVRSTGEPPATD